jgi:hypothetical protein
MSQCVPGVSQLPVKGAPRRRHQEKGTSLDAGPTALTQRTSQPRARDHAAKPMTQHLVWDVSPLNLEDAVQRGDAKQQKGREGKLWKSAVTRTGEQDRAWNALNFFAISASSAFQMLFFG